MNAATDRRVSDRRQDLAAMGATAEQYRHRAKLAEDRVAELEARQSPASASIPASYAFTGATTLAELADEWDKTAAQAEEFCADDAGFMGEAKGLRSAAKELREFLQQIGGVA